jgi:biotin-(acetyl-CoA carboxylase) ligase
VGGVLVESRWRGNLPEWTAIGVGINVRSVTYPGGAALGDEVSRLEVLGELVPALRAAATARGHLTAGEVGEFAARDMGAGRRCREPLGGVVAGVRNDGALLVETANGIQAVRDGSLAFEEDPQRRW